MPLYDTIGKTYDTTRQADADIVRTLLRLLNPTPQGRYLDIACGSGNYTDALAKAGLIIEGIDISEEMLTKAREKTLSSRFIKGMPDPYPFRTTVLMA